MSDPNNNESPGESALQRYLKRKSAETGGAPSPPRDELRDEPREARREELRETDSATSAAVGHVSPDSTTERSAPAPAPPATAGETSVTTATGASAAPSVAEPGGFWWRFLACLIDWIILAVLNGIVVTLFPRFGAGEPAMGLIDWRAGLALAGASTFSYLVLLFFYYGYFYSRRGATPGKMAMELQVVRVDTGAWPSYWRSFFRETVGKQLSFMILGIGFFMAVFTSKRQALHDLIFETQVIHARSGRRPQPTRRPHAHEVT